MRGRKRHLLVDTLGLLRRVLVQPADLADRDGGQELLAPRTDRCPRLTQLWVDAADQRALTDWGRRRRGWETESGRQPRRWGRWPADQAPPPLPTGCQVVPHRGIVERTFAGLGRQRRLRKDDAGRPTTEAAWGSWAMIRLMLVRLAP